MDICTECVDSTKELTSGGLCACPSDMFDNGSTCEAYDVTCDDGFYYPTGETECQACYSDCVTCEG
jgi:hypothetical protein